MNEPGKIVNVAEQYDLPATTVTECHLSRAVNDAPNNVCDHDLWIYGVVFEVIKEVTL